MFENNYKNRLSARILDYIFILLYFNVKITAISFEGDYLSMRDGISSKLTITDAHRGG